MTLSGADIIDDVKFDKLFIDGKIAIDNTQDLQQAKQKQRKETSP